jgi:hypothetical protein
MFLQLIPWNENELCNNQTDTRIPKDGCTVDQVQLDRYSQTKADIVTTKQFILVLLPLNGTSYANRSNVKEDLNICTVDQVLNLTVTP